MNYNELLEKDRNTVLHPFTNLKDFRDKKIDPTIVTGGKGIYIKNHKGEEIIDGFSGLYCMNLGYGRDEIADAISEQAHKLAYFHTYVGHTTEALSNLSSTLLGMLPNMSKVFYGMSGSDANETNAKLVWYYHNIIGKPRKKKIIARDRGYHGCSVISGSMTGMSFYHDYMDLPKEIIKHTGSPHHYWNCKEGESELQFSKRRAAELEELILAEDPETVGAFIAEPVLGTGGITPPPEGYWDEIQKVLKKYDILLIADEVITAFGRTGEDFGSDKYGMKPDFMTMAKGLTSAYVPLSASLISQKVFDVFCQGSDKIGAFSHGYTYSGHPIGAAAAVKVLEIFQRENITKNARDVGAYFNKRLQETFCDNPMVGEIRGVGLMASLEFVANKETKQRLDPTLKVGAQVSAACLQDKLIARAMPHGDILGMAPPLVLTKTEADIIVGKVKNAVEKVSQSMIKSGHVK